MSGGRDALKTDYCSSPQNSPLTSIAEQRDGERTVFIVGSAAVGRYLPLRDTEHQVVDLIDGERAAGDVCGEYYFLPAL